MGPLGVVEVDPLADDPFGREAVGQLVQVDRLVFQRPPQPLDEDVVHAAAATVHGDAHAGVFEDAGEVEAGIALVRVGPRPRLLHRRFGPDARLPGHRAVGQRSSEKRLHRTSCCRGPQVEAPDTGEAVGAEQQELPVVEEPALVVETMEPHREPRVADLLSVAPDAGEAATRAP